MTLFRQGVAGVRGYSPKGIILHNDAGSQAANVAFYRDWLPTHQAENGFAHYYIGSDGIYQAELDSNKAWHCGNSTYNRDYIGIEACQSMGNEATLLANEQASFKLMADLCIKYGIVPNRTTILLHKEVSPTACPHRSWDLHGRSVNSVKDYFIAQIVKYMNENRESRSTLIKKLESEEIGMFVYWSPRKNSDVRDAYGVWGNKRIYLNTLTKVTHFKNIVKAVTGRECMEWHHDWPYGSEQIALVEAFTELK